MTDGPHESEVDEWRRLARRDWHRIHVMVADQDASGAGFYLQQSLEKYLKGFLIATGWRLKKIHALQALLDGAEQHRPALRKFRALCERVSGYYMLERYPFASGGPDMNQLDADLMDARELVLELFPEETVDDDRGSSIG